MRLSSGAISRTLIRLRLHVSTTDVCATTWRPAASLPVWSRFCAPTQSASPRSPPLRSPPLGLAREGKFSRRAQCRTALGAGQKTGLNIPPCATNHASGHVKNPDPWAAWKALPPRAGFWPACRRHPPEWAGERDRVRVVCCKPKVCFRPKKDLQACAGGVGKCEEMAGKWLLAEA